MPAHIRLDRRLTSDTGPLLLALPGAGCSPAIYDEIRVHGWNVLAVDWSRSDGPLDPTSVAQRVRDVIAPLRGPVALLGHSTGAAIAALVSSMTKADGPLSALVLSNTGVHSRHHGDPTLVQRILERWTSDEQEAFLRACFHQPPPLPLWEAMRHYLASIPPEALLEAVRGLRALDLSPSLGSIRTPTLIAHGRYDTRRRVSDAEALAEGIAHARLSLLPGGHTPMVDCPAAYCLAVGDFLEEAIGRQPPSSIT